MKHLALCGALAALLAALLAGCGAKSAPPASVAVKPAESKQPAALTAAPAEPDSMMEPETVLETENAETPRITEQISLEKQCSAGYTTISVHLPKLESDSPDAARINQELWANNITGASTLKAGSSLPTPSCWSAWVQTLLRWKTPCAVR